MTKYHHVPPNTPCAPQNRSKRQNVQKSMAGPVACSAQRCLIAGRLHMCSHDVDPSIFMLITRSLSLADLCRLQRTSTTFPAIENDVWTRAAIVLEREFPVPSSGYSLPSMENILPCHRWRIENDPRAGCTWWNDGTEWDVPAQQRFKGLLTLGQSLVSELRAAGTYFADTYMHDFGKNMVGRLSFDSVLHAQAAQIPKLLENKLCCEITKKLTVLSCIQASHAMWNRAKFAGGVEHLLGLENNHWDDLRTSTGTLEEHWRSSIDSFVSGRLCASPTDEGLVIPGSDRYFVSQLRDNTGFTLQDQALFGDELIDSLCIVSNNWVNELASFWEIDRNAARSRVSLLWPCIHDMVEDNYETYEDYKQDVSYEKQMQLRFTRPCVNPVNPENTASVDPVICEN